MTGTTICVKRAIRRTPPKTIAATPAAMTEEATTGGTPQAFSTAATILLAWMPGRQKPTAMMVQTANNQAYHFCPIAFSIKYAGPPRYIPLSSFSL